MQALYFKGQGGQYLFAGQPHKRLANTLQRDHDLALRDLIHGVDVVDAFALILITLMDRINADIARLIVGGKVFAAGLAMPLIHGSPTGDCRPACRRA